jgi:hypothetical protein
VLRSPRLLFVPVLAGPLLLTGCSTHPLPEDVIDLPIHEIVHRIQCEAASTVKIMRRKWEAGYVNELETVKNNISKLNKDLGPWIKQLNANDDFGRTRIELRDAHSAIILQLLQVAESAAKVVDPTRGGRDTDLQNAELNRLEHEKKRLEGQLATVKSALEALEKLEDMQKKLDEENARLGEGQGAPKDTPLAQLARFQGHKAFFEFIFEVTEDNNASSEGKITWPITMGVITLGYDVGDTKQRMSNRKVRVISTFGELLDESKLNCWDIMVAEETRFPRRYPITGQIGLDEVISDYLLVAAAQGHKFKDGGESYTDTITFTTTVSGGLNPGVNLSKRMGQLVEADLDLSLSRKDMHKVTVFLTPPGGASPGPANEIIIKQMPAVRTRTSNVREPPSG